MFSPLDRTTRSIRLIEILPSQGDKSQIQCKFHMHQLSPGTASEKRGSSRQETLLSMSTSNKYSQAAVVNSKGPHLGVKDLSRFIALSYTWGPPQPASEIIIDEQPFMVRQNLRNALECIRNRLRSPEFDGRRFFWIDAICIDQSNLPERNHQVNMMKDIFSQASLVLVWLGPAENDSGRALKFIATVSTRVGPLGKNTNEPAGPRSMTYLQQKAIKTMMKDLAHCRLEAPIIALCNRMYWTRLWIVQEVILGRDGLILCGQQFCAWDDLAEFMVIVEYLSRIRELPLEDIVLTLMGTRAGLFFENWEYKGGMQRYMGGIGGVVIQWETQKCEDPRDHVYGLLGLLGDDSKIQMLADYGKTAGDIFLDLVKLVELEYPPGDSRRFTIRWSAKLLGCEDLLEE